MENLLNNLVYQNPKSKEKIIFHSLAFYEIIRECIVKYSNKNVEQAEVLMDKYFENCYPPKDYNNVIFFIHELEYHWAMLIVYGKGYWQNNSDILSYPPDDYDEWMEDLLRKKKLPDGPYEILD